MGVFHDEFLRNYPTQLVFVPEVDNLVKYDRLNVSDEHLQTRRSSQIFVAPVICAKFQQVNPTTDNAEGVEWIWEVFLLILQ